jgi:hypothetical protein
MLLSHKPFITVTKNKNKKFSYVLRHYATSQKVKGSIPDEVTGFCN